MTTRVLQSVLLASALCALWPIPSLGGNDINGNQALDVCRVQENWCIGYVYGVVDAVNDLYMVGVMKAPMWCAPEAVTVKQVKDIFIKWLTEHPESRQNTASSELVAALVRAFPCH